MTRNTAILGLAFLILQALVSCQKNCQSVLLKSYRFTQEDLDIVPYQDQDTVTFISSAGHVIMFRSYDRSSHYGQEGFQYVEFPRSDDYCPGNYYFTETNDFRFYGTASADLTFYMGWTNPFVPPARKNLGIGLSLSDGAYYVFGNHYYFDSLKLYENKPPYAAIPVSDNVHIGSKIYDQVYILASGWKYQSPTVSLDTMYYSITEGILGFKSGDSISWHLK